jgi:hypothetical protein
MVISELNVTLFQVYQTYSRLWKSLFRLSVLEMKVFKNQISSYDETVNEKVKEATGLPNYENRKL